MKQIHLYIILLVTSISPMLGSTKESSASESKQTTTTHKQYYPVQYQSSDDGVITVLKVIVPIIIFLLGSYLTVRVLIGPMRLKENELNKSPSTAKEFQDLFIQLSEDEEITSDFKKFESIRKKVGDEILNKPIEGYENVLEYLLVHKKNLDSPLLMLLVDPNNESAAKIKVTEEGLAEVVKAVKNFNHKYLDLLEHILPKVVEPAMLNNKFFINTKFSSALDHFIISKRKDAINVLLSKEAYVKAQIPNTAEGVARAIRLAILDSTYQKYLDSSLKEASEELLNEAAFPQNSSTYASSGTKNAYTLMGQTTYVLYTYYNDQKKMKVFGNILNYLLSTNKEIAISASSMMNIFRIINTKRHDQGVDWFTKMRKKATTPVLSNVLNKLLKGYFNSNSIDLRNTILKVLSNQQGSKFPTQIDEEVLITAASLDYRKEIFSKFKLVPDLLTKTIENKNIVDFLADELVEEVPFSKYIHATFQILENNRYKDKLLRPTPRGLKLAVGVARYVNIKKYLKDLEKIVSEIDIKILEQPLFGKDQSENIFEYALKIQSESVLEAILKNVSYRKRLFTHDPAGFERAVRAAILTPLYHHELKAIYENNRALLTEKIFNSRQENVLDYAIKQKGAYESKPFIKFLLKNPSDQKKFFGQSEESFIRAIKLAIIDQEFLLYLKYELSNNPKINQLLKKRVFSRHQRYTKKTNEIIFIYNPYVNEYDKKPENQVKGQIALDYVIGKKAKYIVDVLLSIPSYKKNILSEILGIKRLLLMIENLGEKYINTLEELQPKFTKEMLNEKIFNYHQRTALEHVLNLCRNNLASQKKTQNMSQEKWNKVINILLKSKGGTDMFITSKKAWKTAIYLAKHGFAQPLQKIYDQVPDKEKVLEQLHLTEEVKNALATIK